MRCVRTIVALQHLWGISEQDIRCIWNTDYDEMKIENHTQAALLIPPWHFKEKMKNSCTTSTDDRPKVCFCYWTVFFNVLRANTNKSKPAIIQTNFLETGIEVACKGRYLSQMRFNYWEHTLVWKRSKK